MEVGTKFILWLVVLAVFVVILSIFVYITGTRDAISDPSPLSSLDVDSTGGDSFGNVPGFGSDSAEPGTVIATVELSTADREGVVPVGSRVAPTATYNVTMRARWSRELHHPFYPSGAHLSPMVAWSHALNDVYVNVGGTSSEGFEIVAETGATKLALEELAVLQGQRQVHSVATGARIDAPGVDETELELTQEKNLVTVVSMIAPSPDWFVAAQNVSLFRNGAWVEQESVEATLYDAGTDSGQTFNSANRDTTPQGRIHRYPLDDRVLPLATFEFTRVR